MVIEIVDLPIKNGGSFHSYVSLPEGMFVITISVIISVNILCYHLTIFMFISVIICYLMICYYDCVCYCFTSGDGDGDDDRDGDDDDDDWWWWWCV